MKTKIVYVITSSDNDIYLEQTYLSIYSLYKYDNNPHVVLLLDDKTDKSLINGREKILELVSEKIVIPFESDVSNMRRSRFLKTKMRNLVDGDFLYIDGDTIINDSLASIDDCSLLIGAIPDAHRPLSVHYGKEKLLRQANTLNFSIDREINYFNGGVLYVKDCSRTREFFDRWHQNWVFSVDNGINQDMPALILTNIQFNHIIEELDGVWNCQLMYGFNYFKKAKISHYFASRYTTNNGGYIHDFLDPSILNNLKQTWIVPDDIDNKLSNPLSCFSNTVELIGGTDVQILNTHVYKFVRILYDNHPRIFNFIQSLFYRFNKFRKSKTE